MMSPYRYAGVDLHLEDHYRLPVWKFLLIAEPTGAMNSDLALMHSRENGWMIFDNGGEVPHEGLLDDLLEQLPDSEKARAMAHEIRRSRE